MRSENRSVGERREQYRRIILEHGESIGIENRRLPALQSRQNTRPRFVRYAVPRAEQQRGHSLVLHAASPTGDIGLIPDYQSRRVGPINQTGLRRTNHRHETSAYPKCCTRGKPGGTRHFGTAIEERHAAPILVISQLESWQCRLP